MKEKTKAAPQKAELTEKAIKLEKQSVRERLKILKGEAKGARWEITKLEHHREAQISFYAAECMEFTDYGEMKENLTLPEAVKAYKSILKRRASSRPGIGFVLQDKRIPDYSDVMWPLFEGQETAQDIVNLIPAFREHPLVKQAVEELRQYLPELTRGAKQRENPAR